MDALFVTVDGGGNLPPALGIAREIVRRGGSARFLGHEPQRLLIERAGFDSRRSGMAVPTTLRPRVERCRAGVN